MSLKDFIHKRLQSYSQSPSNFNPESKKIGNQEWMLENLAIDDGKGEITIKDGNYYYTWDAAMRVAAGIKGWHLPSVEEWNRLATELGGKDTKENDRLLYVDYKFSESILPILDIKLLGYFNGSVRYKGSYECFWTSTEGDISNAFYKSLDTGTLLESKCYRKDQRYSVRLVKD